MIVIRLNSCLFLEMVRLVITLSIVCGEVVDDAGYRPGGKPSVSFAGTCQGAPPCLTFRTSPSMPYTFVERCVVLCLAPLLLRPDPGLVFRNRLRYISRPSARPRIYLQHPLEPSAPTVCAV
jgi:hypothetical protein